MATLVENKEEFANSVVEGIRGAFPDAKVMVGNVRKNNGIDLTAISIFQPGECISPNIYLEEFFNDYMLGKITIDEVVSVIVDTYENADVPKFETGLFDFESIKDKIECSLVNFEENEELLKTVPHIKFLDLAIVFRIRVDYLSPSSTTVASVLVTDSHFSEWGISIDTLKEVAVENIKRTGFEVVPMMDFILEKLLEDSPFSSDLNDLNDLLGVTEVPDVPMYILSNHNKMRGAGVVLFALNEIEEKVGCKQFYVIPSSIHEVIIYTGEDVDNVKYLIEDANRNVVTKEDFLSDNLYYYDGETLSIVE